MNKFTLKIAVGALIVQMVHVPTSSGFAPEFVTEIIMTAFPGVMTVEKEGTTAIEPANKYSENTTLKATVVFPPNHPKEGQVVTKFDGAVVFTEKTGTKYHNFQAFQLGATFLPIEKTAASGVTTVTLKSLSGHDTSVSFPGPPPATIGVATKNLLDGVIPAEKQVFQWVNDDGDPQGMIDWLDLKSNAILSCLKTNASGEAAAVFNSVAFIKPVFLDCGGTDRDDGINEIGISPKCTAFNGHRLNLANQLTTTIAHEARHAWVFKELRRNTTSQFIKDDDGKPETFANDDDGDFWPEYLQGFASANSIIEAASPSGSDNPGVPNSKDPDPAGPFGAPGPQEDDARNFGLLFQFSQCK